MYQPPAMRWRGISVLTNTPPRVSHSAPGGMQGVALMEPVLAKAARKLGIDQVAIRRINAPEGKAEFGPPGANGNVRTPPARSLKKPSIAAPTIQMARADRGSQESRHEGAWFGVAMSCFRRRHDRLRRAFRDQTRWRVCFQSGIGNLGTESVHDMHRVAAEILGVPWEKCEIFWGSTAKNLPWTCASGGSQTTHAMTRAAYAVAMDAKKKLQEIAAKRPRRQARRLRSSQRARLP